ncbi:acyl-CoA dehydrogenase family protein [Rudaea sp.]|uniref:acyl-CoA dehydrogenase family protein n=1 Tax=Rudaea sp. TaxID=2136325 RepID=UPI003783503D
MDFSFSQEQQLLLDATRRFVSERYPFEYRQSVRASTEGWSRQTWEQLADLGLLALAIPEGDGGMGGGPVETMLVCNATGAGLLLEPFMDSAIVATRAIVELASPEQRQRWLPSMAAGKTIAVLAHDEPANDADALDVQTRARRHANGWRLEGSKPLVYHAPAADLLLVSARGEDEIVGLFAVPAGSPGLRCLPRKTVDDQCAAEVRLDGVDVDAGARLGGDARGGLRNALDAGLAALCAEAFGAMDKVFATTVEYCRSRTQFAAPIGSFQALQHRMADMLMRLEEARSMSYLAASACVDPNPASRRAALSAAKALMGQCARYIGQQAVQLHGGMGMTDELDVSHCFKRLLAFELRGGTTDRHLRDYRVQMQAA